MSKKLVFDYGNIFIAKEDQEVAFNDLKTALILEHSKRTGNENKLLWIDIAKVNNCDNLKDLLTICQWHAEYDLNNNIDTLKSNINLLGEDELIFKSLAPSINNDSILIMYAENEIDLYREYRYIFDDGSMFKIKENGARILVS